MDRISLGLAAIAVAAACFGGGYGLGQCTGDSERLSASGKASSERTAPTVRSRSGRGTEESLAALQRNPKLQALAAAGAGRNTTFLDRYRVHLRMISIADVSELPGILVHLEREMPEDLGGDSLRDLILKRWTEEDPMGALRALVHREPASLEENEGLILEQALANNQAATLEVLQSVEPWNRRHELLGAVLAEIAGSEPEKAVAMARELGAPVEFASIWEDVLGRLSFDPESAELFLKTASELRPSMIDEAYYMQVFDTLANVSRERALEALGSVSHRAHRLEAIEALSGKFPVEEMGEAMAWVNTLAPGIEQDRALQGILETASRDDPETARAMLNRLPLPQRSAFAQNLASSWFARDRDEAMRWVDGDLEGLARENALSGILRWRHDDLTHEEQLAMANEITGTGQARTDFIRRWALRDPEAAVAWSREQQRGAEPYFHLYSVRGWYENDPRAAIEHVSSLAGVEDSHLRAGAVNWLARIAGSDDSVLALVHEVDGEDGTLAREMQAAGSPTPWDDPDGPPLVE